MLSSAFAIVILLTAAGPAGTSFPEPAGDDLVVLTVADPAGDQECVFHRPCRYPGGDIRGVTLTLKKIPVPRSETTAESAPDTVFIPWKLELNLEPKLTRGEVQQCIFISIPPLFIEHVMIRNSIRRQEPGFGDVEIVLEGQREFSFALGLDPMMDEAIAEFKEAGFYQDCFFDSPPEKKDEAFRQAAKLNIHQGLSYRFPPRPAFYWTKIPSITISTSLVARKEDTLRLGELEHIINDTLKYTGVSAGAGAGGQPAGAAPPDSPRQPASRAYPLGQIPLQRK